MSGTSAAILTLDGLGVRLPPGADRPQALSAVSLSIAANEILCVVGESGSGKSIMANAIMRLLPDGVSIDAGRVMFEGRDLATTSAAEMRRVRGAGIAMIFQEPMTALNPLRTIGDQIGEMFSIHTEPVARPPSAPGCWHCSKTCASPIPEPPRGPIRTNCRAASASAP